MINFSFQAIFYYDAAIATGPFITTFIDVLGISLFFAVAKYLLKL